MKTCYEYSLEAPQRGTSNKYPQNIFSWRNKKNTRQSAQWGMYTPDQRYRQFLKSTKYVALTLEKAVICFMW